MSAAGLQSATQEYYGRGHENVIYSISSLVASWSVDLTLAGIMIYYIRTPLFCLFRLFYFSPNATIGFSLSTELENEEDDCYREYKCYEKKGLEDAL